jgi:putative DNA primase/helicase
VTAYDDHQDQDSSGPAPVVKRRKVGTFRFEVRDVFGVLQGTKVRTNLPNGEKKHRWDPLLNGRRPETMPLHGSELVRDWTADKTIILTEGEPKAIALRELGFCALATTTGSGVIPDLAALAPCVGRDIVLWPDNDPTGRAHMDGIGRSLLSRAASVFTICWEEAPAHGDAVDFLATHTADDLVALLEASQPFEPTSTAISADQITPRRVDWVWKNRIALGKLTMLDGRPGLFKSGMSLDIAARITTGREMPDGQSSGLPPSNVLVATAEDDWEDTVVPRLMAAGADLSRVFRFDDFELPGSVDALEQFIADHEIRFFVIDPLVAFVSTGHNLYHDQQSRKALKPLAMIAQRTRSAAFGLRHMRKGNVGQAQEGGAGSVAIGGAARSNLVAAPDPDDEDRFILASVKNNLGVKPPSLAYRIEEEGVHAEDGTLLAMPVLRWEGEVDVSADDLMTGGEKQGATVRFLEDALAEGPRSAKDLERLAKQLELSWAGTVWRTSKRMGIEKAPQEFGGEWMWALPPAYHLAHARVGGVNRGTLLKTGLSSVQRAEGQKQPVFNTHPHITPTTHTRVARKAVR